MSKFETGTVTVMSDVMGKMIKYGIFDEFVKKCLKRYTLRDFGDMSLNELKAAMHKADEGKAVSAFYRIPEMLQSIAGANCSGILISTFANRTATTIRFVGRNK